MLLRKNIGLDDKMYRMEDRQWSNEDNRRTTKRCMVYALEATADVEFMYSNYLIIVVSPCLTRPTTEF